MAVPMLQMALLGALPSPLKIAYYRWRGAKIGRNVKIGFFSVILADEIQLGDGVRVGALSFIACRKLTLGNRVRIGSMVAIETNEVKIGHDSAVMEQVVIGGMRTPRSRISLGARVKVFPYSFLNPTEPITIEDDVGIGGANYLFTHGSWQPVIDGFPVAFGPITIRRGTWLPWRVFIHPNVEIGEYCTIGAGSIVTRSIPSRSLAVGAPAKVLLGDGAHLAKRTEDEKIALVHKILNEMAEFLSFEGKAVQALSPANPWRIEIQREDARERVEFHVGDFDSAAQPLPAVLISWPEIGPSTEAALQLAGITWFDLKRRLCAPGRSASFEDVRGFFSRYGIRFAWSGEADI